MAVKCICESCGRVFFVKRSAFLSGAGKHCSRACRKLGHEKPCDYCGKSIFVRPSAEKAGEGKYCSLRCRGKARAVLYVGANSPRWKGGIRKAGNRYVARYVPDHPRASRKYVMEHRLVVEKALGRRLGSQEVVHHINGDPTDNRVENLRVFNNQAEHAKHHQETISSSSRRGQFSRKAKRTLAALLLAGILAVPLPGDERKLPDPHTDSLFFSLKVNYSAMTLADFSMTTVALNRYRMYMGEANPIARAYVEKPEIAVPFLLIHDISVHVFGDWLYKKNKTLAYVFIGVLTLVRVYVMYENVRTIQRVCR